MRNRKRCWALLCALFVGSCADCPDQAYQVVAHTPCDEDELDVHGCGDELYIECRGEAWYCHIYEKDELSTCRKLP